MFPWLGQPLSVGWIRWLIIEPSTNAIITDSSIVVFSLVLDSATGIFQFFCMRFAAFPELPSVVSMLGVLRRPSSIGEEFPEVGNTVIVLRYASSILIVMIPIYTFIIFLLGRIIDWGQPNLCHLGVLYVSRIWLPRIRDTIAIDQVTVCCFSCTLVP
ncbi:hypothetical protein BJ742DRAFT_808480 [Cladochytrium replicatum]|nr:hypothetical protein BJ742DRAFT_808480 [Cladochytrium replicatum]